MPWLTCCVRLRDAMTFRCDALTDAPTMGMNQSQPSFSVSGSTLCYPRCHPRCGILTLPGTICRAHSAPVCSILSLYVRVCVCVVLVGIRQYADTQEQRGAKQDGFRGIWASNPSDSLDGWNARLFISQFSFGAFLRRSVCVWGFSNETPRGW